MVARITKRTVHEEASASTRIFDVVRWIRARRLQWVGHILRMDQDRLVYKALYYEHTHRTEGGLLMDLHVSHTWRDLCVMASDRSAWRARVKALRTGGATRIQAPDPTLRHHYRTRSKADATNPPTTQETDTPAKPKTTSSRKRPAANYSRRDAHALFFRPRDGSKKRQRAKPPQKRKKSSWTDAQRAAFAREHYARNHGPRKPPPPTKNESSPPPPSTPVPWTPPQILGHHHHHPPEGDTTVAPIQWKDFFDYSPEADRRMLQNISNLCDESPPPPSSPSIAWTPPQILGHHHHQTQRGNTTMTPINWNEWVNYSPEADRKRLQDISSLCP